MKRLRAFLASTRDALAGVLERSTLEITIGPVKLNVFRDLPERSPPAEPSELARRAKGGE